jgi:fatty-acyl-CoA synthase
MDPAGYISIQGRIKDLIIRGGENIYPKEIEQFMLGFQEVLDVHVFGVKDEEYGE